MVRRWIDGKQRFDLREVNPVHSGILGTLVGLEVQRAQPPVFLSPTSDICFSDVVWNEDAGYCSEFLEFQ